MSVYRREDDGSLTPIEPLGWQGHGVDWEVYRRADDTSGAPRATHHVANGYDEGVLVGTVRARTLWGLNRKMRKVERAHDLPRNGVLG